MPTVSFAIDAVPAAGADAQGGGSQDTTATDGVFSDSFATDSKNSDDKTASSSTLTPHNRRHSDRTALVRRSNINTQSHQRRERVRRRSTSASTNTGNLFQDLSNSVYNSLVGPVVNSLREEQYDRRRRNPASGSVASSDSFRDEMDDDSYNRTMDDMDATWYEQVPYLDDTMVDYSTTTPIGGKRKLCGAIVNHPATQSCILCMITVNAIMMGAMTFDAVSNNPDMVWYFNLCDWILLGLFVVEVILQLIWHGKAALADPWLMFDVGILCCSWVPELRIFRFARVINRLEMLHNLTRAIGLVMPRMFSIALFLFIIIYTYSVLFTVLFRDVSWRFDGLFQSMFTCFEMMTLEWAEICRELEDEDYAWLPITTFVVICGIIFFNLVLAVICDAVAVLGVDWSGRNAEERQRLKDLENEIVDVGHRIHRLKELFRQLIKNQKNALHLLEVQLAKQLNDVQTLSNLTNEAHYRSNRTQLHGRQDMLSRLTQDHKFREQNLITQIRIVSGLILESDIFEFFVFCVICVDCALMGVATFDAVNETKWIGYVDTASFVFLIIYTAEAVMGFIYLGRGVFSDAWMTFDVFIVVTSWAADLLQGVKAFREFRAVRIVRAFRLITALHQLRDLVVAIGMAIPRVSKIMPLLLLIFYIFAVLFLELFRDVQYDDGYDYFGRLDKALFTCLQMMTMEWANLARESLDKTGLWWANTLFVLFVWVSGMLFFDLIKATVCDAVAVINGRSRRLAEIRKCRKRLRKMSDRVDEISHQVFHAANFQNHINRMMMKDLENLAPKKRGGTNSQEDKDVWMKLQQTLESATKKNVKTEDRGSKASRTKKNVKTEDQFSEESSQGSLSKMKAKAMQGTSSQSKNGQSKNCQSKSSQSIRLKKRSKGPTFLREGKKQPGKDSNNDDYHLRLRRTKSGTVDHSRR